MFLHVTTRLKGRKHDDLLAKKSFTGFPTLCAMDASGNVTAKHAGKRTLPLLAKTVTSGKAYEMLATQAAAGDKSATQHIFAKDLELGRYTYARGMLRFRALRNGMPKALRGKARQALVDQQYAELSKAVRATLRTSRAAYTKRWNQLQMDFFHSGSLPSGYRASSVLNTVLSVARKNKNAKLFERALKMFKTRFGDNKVYQRRIESLESQLSKMQGK